MVSSAASRSANLLAARLEGGVSPSRWLASLRAWQVTRIASGCAWASSRRGRVATLRRVGPLHAAHAISRSARRSARCAPRAVPARSPLVQFSVSFGAGDPGPPEDVSARWKDGDLATLVVHAEEVQILSAERPVPRPSPLAGRCAKPLKCASIEARRSGHAAAICDAERRLRFAVPHASHVASLHSYWARLYGRLDARCRRFVSPRSLAVSAAVRFTIFNGSDASSSAGRSIRARWRNPTSGATSRTGRMFPRWQRVLWTFVPRPEAHGPG
jgi:hypothetical protein